MFLFRKPSEQLIRDYLSRQADQPYSYADVGGTRTSRKPSWRWNADHQRVLLGYGQSAFEKAEQAIENWRMFPPAVATICWPELPREGLHVAVLYRAPGFGWWLLLAARVIYLIDEAVHHNGRTIQRFGFAYGTLPGHAERGEERFLVEWERSDDSVTYDLLAISRPRHWLAWLGYPYTRYEQARFRRLSGEAMQRAVTSPP
jgi:uncharacterized protein (UPF0548 family)